MDYGILAKVAVDARSLITKWWRCLGDGGDWCLVVPLVFKTSVGLIRSRVGSIPIRLRHFIRRRPHGFCYDLFAFGNDEKKKDHGFLPPRLVGGCPIGIWGFCAF